jgi:transposase-like protein
MAVTVAVGMAERDAAEIARILSDYESEGAKPVAVAAKHNLSERTLYRIVAKARKSGVGSSTRRGTSPEIPSRTPPRVRARANKDVPELVAPEAPQGAKSSGREAGIARITELMVRGQWATGCIEELAVEFGASVHTIRSWAHDASVALRASVDPHKVTAYWLESVDFLATEAYQARAKADTRTAILAMSRLGQLCGSMIRGAAEHTKTTPATTNEREAHQRLVELGWKPPESVAGLPMPDCDDPTGLFGAVDQGAAPEGQANERAKDPSDSSASDSTGT